MDLFAGSPCELVCHHNFCDSKVLFVADFEELLSSFKWVWQLMLMLCAFVAQMRIFAGGCMVDDESSAYGVVDVAFDLFACSIVGDEPHAIGMVRQLLMPKE